MRKRMTWNDERGVRQRRASSDLPHEGAASPAHHPDKGADGYDIGGPSEFGEDVHAGPYADTAHPATPDEGPASPAYKAAALERKAAKCIRLATAMLGEGASVAAIEDQALALMDLPDRSIKASLSRIAEDADEAIDKDEAAEAEEDLKEESKKKASLSSRISRLERILVKLAGDDDDDDDDDDDEEEEEEVEVEEESKKKASYHEMMEDMMLQEMLHEEGMMGKYSESHDPGDHDTDSSMGMSEDPGDYDTDSSMGMHHDPMGMGMMVEDEDEMMVLAKLFGKEADLKDEDKKEKEDHEKGAIADDKDHIEKLEKDEDEDAEDLEKDEESKKKASLRPQPKRASKGAKTLGGVSKAASSEVSDLSKLWESAPDVSKFF